MVVRGEVRRILAGSPAFRQLPEMTRLQLARDMTRVAEAIVGAADPRATARALGERLERGSKRADDERGARHGPQAPAEPRSGKRVRVVAVRERAEAPTSADFPTFVADLLKGTFAAVVDASIQQMDAYSRLVAEAAGKLDEFIDRDPGAED